MSLAPSDAPRPHLGPVRAQLKGAAGVSQGAGVVAQAGVGGRAVAEEDVVVPIQRDGGRIVGHRPPQVPLRQSPVPPLLQRLCLWGEEGVRRRKG